MTDLERAKEALTTIDCTCALCRDEEVRTTQLRGVAPLLSWLEEGLSGWSVADRVVGAGAAWLYTLLHPAMVYAPVMSRRVSFDFADTIVRNLIKRFPVYFQISFIPLYHMLFCYLEE